jgi:hypothetical protein
MARRQPTTQAEGWSHPSGTRWPARLRWPRRQRRHRSSDRARPAYALLGVPDRLGVNFAPHGHAFTPDDWTALLDVFDTHRRGKPVDRTFDRFPTEQELDAALQRPAPAR